MADPNAFSNKELEDLNVNIKKEIEAIKKNLNLEDLKKKLAQTLKKPKNN